MRREIAGELSLHEETKKEQELTGDAEREGGAGLERRLVDELDISGL